MRNHISHPPSLGLGYHSLSSGEDDWYDPWDGENHSPFITYYYPNPLKYGADPYGPDVPPIIAWNGPGLPPPAGFFCHHDRPEEGGIYSTARGIPDTQRSISNTQEKSSPIVSQRDPSPTPQRGLSPAYAEDPISTRQTVPPIKQQGGPPTFRQGDPPTTRPGDLPTTQQGGLPTTEDKARKRNPSADQLPSGLTAQEAIEIRSRGRRRSSAKKRPSTPINVLPSIEEVSSSIEEEHSPTGSDFFDIFEDDASSVVSAATQATTATTADTASVNADEVSVTTSTSVTKTTTTTTAVAADASTAVSAAAAPTPQQLPMVVHTQDPLMADYPKPEGEIDVGEALGRKPGRWSIVGQREANQRSLAIQKAREIKDAASRSAAFENTKKELLESFKALSISLPR